MFGFRWGGHRAVGVGYLGDEGEVVEGDAPGVEVEHGGLASIYLRYFFKRTWTWTWTMWANELLWRSFRGVFSFSECARLGVVFTREGWGRRQGIYTSSIT